MTRSKAFKLASAAPLVLMLIVVSRMMWTSVQVAVDNHCCAAPNADTLYSEVWLDLSREPWVFAITGPGLARRRRAEPST